MAYKRFTEKTIKQTAAYKKKPVTTKKERMLYKSLPPTSESKFQEKCHAWFQKTFPDKLSYSIPNGANTAEYVQKDEEGNEKKVNLERLKLLREGMLPGAADYFIQEPIQNKESRFGWYFGLHIELKFNGGTQKDNQKDFQRKVEARGFKYLIVRENENIKNAEGVIDPLLHFKKAVYQYFGI